MKNWSYLTGELQVLAAYYEWEIYDLYNLIIQTASKQPKLFLGVDFLLQDKEAMSRFVPH